MRIRNISLIGLLMLVVVFSADADRRRMMLKLRPAGGGGAQAFSDDFAGTGALSGNWTVIQQCARVSDQAKSDQTFDNTLRGAAYTGTACNTVNQYVKMTMTNNVGANVKPGAVFRFTDASSAFYEIRADLGGDILSWVHWTTTTGTETQIATQSIGLIDGDTLGITITGTGTATIVRVWINPTGLPDAADDWDGDVTPDHTFTNDPASAVDTGNYVGIGGVGSLGALFWDDFFGGDIP